MKRIVPFLFLLPGVAAQASAEKADAYKQTRIDCRKCDQDTLTGIALMDGGVTITRGTMPIDAWSGRVETSPEGYQRATLEAGSGSKARFHRDPAAAPAARAGSSRYRHALSRCGHHLDVAFPPAAHYTIVMNGDPS